MKEVRSRNPYRVMLVEDDVEIRRGIQSLLVAQPDFELLAVADCVVQGKNLLSDKVQLLLLDLGLPDGSGLDVLQTVKQRYPSIKVIVFTVFADSRNTMAALEAGADGYVLKDAENIIDVLRRTMRGEHPISPEVTQHLLRQVRSSMAHVAETDEADVPQQSVNLTPRERETLTALAQGLSFSEIALNLKISTNTITDYSKSLYRKLGVNSRAEAVYEGVRRGLVSF